MAYKYNPPPPYPNKIFWIQLIKPLPGEYKIPGMEVGDITWNQSDGGYLEKGEIYEVIHPENNRYSLNFPSDCFELLTKLPKQSQEINYEIY